MKSILLVLFLLTSFAGAQTPEALPAPTPPILTTAQPGQVVVVQQPAPVRVTPEHFQEEAMKWVQVVTTVIGGITVLILPAIALLWAKVSDVVKRQDRQAAKNGSMQEQITTIAQATPPTINPDK